MPTKPWDLQRAHLTAEAETHGFRAGVLTTVGCRRFVRHRETRTGELLLSLVRLSQTQQCAVGDDGAADTSPRLVAVGRSPAHKGITKSSVMGLDRTRWALRPTMTSGTVVAVLHTSACNDVRQSQARDLLSGFRTHAVQTCGSTAKRLDESHEHVHEIPLHAPFPTIVEFSTPSTEFDETGALTGRRLR